MIHSVDPMLRHSKESRVLPSVQPPTIITSCVGTRCRRLRQSFNAVIVAVVVVAVVVVFIVVDVVDVGFGAFVSSTVVNAVVMGGCVVVLGVLPLVNKSTHVLAI